MPVRLTFEFYGEAQVDRTLARFEARALDARPAWEVLHAMFLRAETRQFNSQGAYGSGGWPPLSPRYAAWKARHYPGRPILVREGDLRASLTEANDGAHIYVAEPHLFITGSSDPVGAYHQAGAGHLPRRRPVEFPESLRRNMAKVVQRFIVTGKV